MLVLPDKLFSQMVALDYFGSLEFSCLFRHSVQKAQMLDQEYLESCARDPRRRYLIFGRQSLHSHLDLKKRFCGIKQSEARLLLEDRGLGGLGCVSGKQTPARVLRENFRFLGAVAASIQKLQQLWAAKVHPELKSFLCPAPGNGGDALERPTVAFGGAFF